MKKTAVLSLFILMLAFRAYANTGINTAIAFGPYGFWQGAVGMDFNQETRLLGINAVFAGSRGLDGLITAEVSGGLKISDELNPGVAYRFSKASSRIIIDYYDPAWISYLREMSSHSVRFFNTSQLGAIKITPLLEIRYSKLEEQAVEATVLSAVLAWKELEDLNPGAVVSWQALDWLQVSVGGNKRLYFNNVSAALDATDDLLIHSKGQAILKTAVSVGDYAASLSAEANAWNAVFNLSYEYNAFHAGSNINCISFSHNFTVSAGYDFSDDIKARVKGEAINNYFVDGYMLSGFYLTVGGVFGFK